MSISSDGDVIDLVTPPSDTQMLQDIERRSTALTQEGQTMSKRERDDDDKDSDIVYSMNAKKPSQSDEVAEKNTFPQLMGIEKSQEEANELLASSLQLLCDSGIENPALASLLRQTVRRQN